MPKSLKNKIGNPVEADDFWPRPEIVGPLVDDLLNDRGSRRIFGLRRIGKSSIIREVKRQLETAGSMTVIHIDVQGVHKFGDFLGLVFKALPASNRNTDAWKKVASNPTIKTLAASLYSVVTQNKVEHETKAFTNEFDHHSAWSGDIEDAIMAAGPLVLIIDELPYMLRNMLKSGYKAVDAERFLATLRDWRLNCGVRMLVAGSIGLGQLERDDGVQVTDHIGDLPPIIIPPLSRASAAEMIASLAKGAEIKDWSAEHTDALLDASAELWPIFLQTGFDAIRKASPCPPDQIQQIVEATVRQTLDENFYSQFRTRLTRYGDTRKSAQQILREVVATQEISTNDLSEKIKDTEGQDVDDIIDALVEDNFLIYDTKQQTLRPSSKLVTIWVQSRSWGR